MNKPNYDEFDDDCGSISKPTEMVGRVSVTDLSDEQLLYYYDRLHNPNVLADRWLLELQAEVLRRELRKD